jgi:type I restriction enzyme S subunit
MSQLPAGWVRCKLDDVILDHQPGFASGKKDVADGLKHLRMNNISVDGKLNLDLVRTVPRYLASQRHFLRKGDVLICTTNSGKLVGKSALMNIDGEFAFSNHLTRLRPNTTVEGKFLQYQLWLQWKEGAFEHKCKHWVNQSTLPKVELLSTDLALAPKNEQRRIVSKLEKLLSRVETAQERLATIPKILKHFRQSVLAAACSGRLTVEWRKKNRLSDDYNPRTVADVADYQGGFAYKSSSFTETGSNQVVRIGNVRPLQLMLDASPVFIPSEIASETVRFKLRQDDLVISMTGTKYKKDYGYVAIVNGGDRNLFLNQRVSRLRSKPMVLPRFLLYWLQTDLFREYFFKGETGNVNQGNVGADGIRNALIHVPSMPEQQEIVRRVEALFKTADAPEARYLKAKAHVDKLTQSILAKAFRGELVPQDPNDEPAAVLLERIRDQRNGTADKKRTGQ